MTTLKGALRSYSAAVKRTERAHQKRAREAAHNYKQYQKQQDIQNVTKTVAQHNEYIDVLKSLHKDSSETLDWNDVKKTPPPLEEAAENKKEKQARQRLLSYSPSLLDKLFKNKDKKIKDLTHALEQAILLDKADHEKYLLEYKSALSDWRKLQKIAEGIQSKNVTAYKDVIQYFEPFAEIKDLGAEITLNFEPTYVVIDLRVNTDVIIPKYILTQTSTGKLSKKEAPLSKFNELYQDYVCSCILRVAREIYAYIPLEFVFINAITKMLDPVSGHMENTTILSVAIPPATLRNIKFDTVDPSDSMRNFIHNMKFTKSGGFSKVEKIDPHA
jgi:gas vesicle protein